jgi:hypothetical protein
MPRKKLNLVRATVALDAETEKVARVRFGILKDRYGEAISWSGYLASLVKGGLIRDGLRNKAWDKERG